VRAAQHLTRTLLQLLADIVIEDGGPAYQGTVARAAFLVKTFTAMEKSFTKEKILGKSFTKSGFSAS
jgi:hypothetical protein